MLVIYKDCNKMHGQQNIKSNWICKKSRGSRINLRLFKRFYTSNRYLTHKSEPHFPQVMLHMPRNKNLASSDVNSNAIHTISLLFSW
jgi:hypothetical protein